MHYSLEKNFCFVHVPKTAGVAIINALLQVAPDLRMVQDDRDRLGFIRDGAFDNHYTYKQGRETFEAMPELSERYDNFKFFMVYRDPWDRMVSLFNHRRRKPWHNTEADNAKLTEGFTSWLTTTGHRSDSILTIKSQVSWMDGVTTPYIQKKEFPFETLNGDEIGKFLGTEPLVLQPANVGQVQKDSYRDYYDDVAREHVETFFSRDIEFGGYKF